MKDDFLENCQPPTAKAGASSGAPFNLEAEQGVLGCMLDDPNECVPECISKLRDGASEFYDMRHQVLYTAMTGLYDAKQAFDLITVADYLRKIGKLEDIGGLEYLGLLTQRIPSSANLPYYVEIVRECHLKRRMLSICATVAAKVKTAPVGINELLDECEGEMLALSESRVSSSLRGIRELVSESLARIENLMTRRGEISGLRSGFADLDRLTGGFRPGEMIIIAARPSLGKTSLAMNIADFVAVNCKIPVAIFSLEMTAAAIVDRMICSRARVNLRALMFGMSDPTTNAAIADAASKIAAAPIFIDDESGQSILQVRAKARRWRNRYQIGLAIIDYIQLLTGEGIRKKYEGRQQEMSQVSAGIKNLAKELGIPIIALSQLNRNIERDKGRRPCLSDLRETGSLEQDGDLIAFLYRPATDDDEPLNDTAFPVNLSVAKQRNGPIGDVQLTFMREYTRFESAARVTVEDAPTPRSAEIQEPLGID